MFNVDVVTWAVGFYGVFELDVSVRKYGYSIEAEDRLPYTMSEMYKTSFKMAKTFLRTYLCYTAYAFGAGAVFYYTYKWGILETGGIMGNDGKTLDLFSYGIIATSCLAVSHHFQVAVYVRNWGIIYTLVFIFSLG